MFLKISWSGIVVGLLEDLSRAWSHIDILAVVVVAVDVPYYALTHSLVCMLSTDLNS